VSYFDRTARRRSITASLGVGTAVLLLLAAWTAFAPSPGDHATEHSHAKLSASPMPSQRAAKAQNVEPTIASVDGDAGVTAPTRQVPITPIPPLGTRGKTKLWVRSKYGAAEELLGFRPIPPGGAGASRVPQGFVVTKEGDLLVLDSEKKRLVWYGRDAQIKRKLPLEGGLLMPADIAIAADGTIAVMDHEGIHTKGTVLLSPDGKLKGMLPQSGGGMIREMYTVGNDVFGDVGGAIKLGETSGVPSHETPGLYDQDGRVPGNVAPDGRTIVTSGVESRKEGRFFISVLRDDPPKHLYTRQYVVPVKSSLSIPYVQSDATGTIYVVLYYDRDKTTLVCLDGETGDPLGSVAMPMDDAMTGSAFKQWSINREQGGLVYHHLLEDASSFEIYDCR